MVTKEQRVLIDKALQQIVNRGLNELANKARYELREFIENIGIENEISDIGVHIEAKAEWTATLKQ